MTYDLLFHKLKSFGIAGNLLNWFGSYITNRSQRVVLEGASSDWLPVLSGVPQGSILGPTLFILYTNDMGDSLSIETQLALYADDAKLSRTISSIHDCRTLQTDLDTVQRWSNIWRLNFNTAKCNVLRFTRVLKFDFAYQLNDTVLNSVKFFKDLGLTVTDTLSWKPHIANVVSKANKLLGLVKRTLGFRAPLKSKLLLYKSLVMSTLNYASIIWSPDKGDLILLESVQRRATKYILNDYDSDYKTRLARLDLLPISYIKEFYDLCFFYKCIHRFYDFDISHIIPLPNVRRPGTRLGQDTSRLARQPIRTETAAHLFLSSYRQLMERFANVRPFHHMH
jgi:hypothetical protein